MSDRTPFDELLDNLIVELHREKHTNSFSDPIYDAIHRLALVVADTRMMCTARRSMEQFDRVVEKRAGACDDVRQWQGREIQRLRDEVEAAKAQLAAAIAERDEVCRLKTKLTEAHRQERADLRTIVEHETQEAIAAWFEQHREPHQLSRERIAEDVRERRWSKP